MLMKAAEGYVCISPAASGVKDIAGRTAVCVSTTKLHTGRQNAMVALFILQGGAAFTAPAGEGLFVGSKYRNGSLYILHILALVLSQHNCLVQYMNNRREDHNTLPQMNYGHD